MENAETGRQESLHHHGAPLPPGLFLAATPIGAADDVTLRVLDALRRADALVAEDTRVLRRLMEIHGVALGGRPLLSYHDRNGPTARPKILRLLAEGKSVVYASDAGTPLVADPGYRLAEAARAAGAPVVVLPGPSAVLTALLASGFATDAFSFCGFPPPKSARRRSWLSAWRTTPGTLIFFEAPRRLAESLGDMAAILGDRPAAVLRELTKKFEEARHGSLGALAAGDAGAPPPRGEAVVVVAPRSSEPTAPEADRAAAVDNALKERMKIESLKDAVRTVTEQMDEPRNFVYARAVALREGGAGATDDAERQGGAGATDDAERQGGDETSKGDEPA